MDFEMAPSGSPVSTLWDELVSTSRRHAAAGFICDMFEHHARISLIQNENEAIDTGVNKLRSQVKEDLRHILKDKDGFKFRLWLKLFNSNVPASRDSESYGSEFDRQAYSWACDCCDSHV